MVARDLYERAFVQGQYAISCSFPTQVCVCVIYFRLYREVGKANEALTRIGMGLAANPSVTEPEMLLYVHATVAPFLLPQVFFSLQQ